MDEKYTHNRFTTAGTAGFTLMEVLIAIVLLTIGLLGMAALTVGVMDGNTHSRELTTATTLAQDQMEEMKRLGYFNTPSTDTTTTQDYGSISGYPLFKRVTTTDVDNPAVNMKMVLVTVFWGSDAKSVVLETLLTR